MHKSALKNRHSARFLSMCAVFCVVSIVAISFVPAARAASSWKPTLLVNTESFQAIDSGDLASNVELRFGASAESMIWSIAKSQFEFSDDVHVEGNITGSGGLGIESNIRAKGDYTINSDNGATDAVLTFGNNILPQNLTFATTPQKFRFSTSLDVAGTMSGYAITVSGLRNCNTIDTNQNGVLTCGSDEGGVGGGSFGSGQVVALGDNRYVKKSGDTMTGSLNVRGTISGSIIRASNMTVSGAVVYTSGSTLRQTAKGLSGQLLISQGTAAPKWAAPAGGMVWYFDSTQAVASMKGPQIVMPFGLTLSGVLITAKGAPIGAALIYDINKNGTTIFSTRPEVAAGATSGGTGAVLSSTTIPVNSVITLDIDQVEAHSRAAA